MGNYRTSESVKTYFDDAERKLTAGELGTKQQPAEEAKAAKVREHASHPISWFKHDASNANFAQFLATYGFDSYGRYWALAEYAARTSGHAIPSSGERQYKNCLRQLGFSNDEAGAAAFEDFISLLVDFDLAVEGEGGRRSIAAVDQAAQTYGERCYNGGQGGRKASDNRRRYSN